MITSIKFKVLLAALCTSLIFTSCMKDDKNYEPIFISGLSFIHASPTTEKLDVYIQNSKVETQNFVFKSKLDYLRAYAGKRTISVSKAGATTKLKTDSVDLEKDMGYSVFIIDRLETLSFLKIKDDLTAPASGKAKIRFINLSPDAGSLHFSLANASTNLVEDKNFKDYSNFIIIDASDKVSFVVKDKTSGNTITTLNDIKIEAGKIYTVYANGLKANTDALKLSASIFTHK